MRTTCLLHLCRLVNLCAIGDVIFLRLFSRPTLVLNSLTAARDLLDKRSVKYSDRPRMVLMNELYVPTPLPFIAFPPHPPLFHTLCSSRGSRIGFSNSVPTMAYGERFRRQRKWIHDAMGTRGALASYEPSMRRGAHALLRDLLDSPDAFSEHLYKYVLFPRPSCPAPSHRRSPLNHFFPSITAGTSHRLSSRSRTAGARRQCATSSSSQPRAR